MPVLIHYYFRQALTYQSLPKLPRLFNSKREHEHVDS